MMSLNLDYKDGQVVEDDYEKDANPEFPKLWVVPVPETIANMAMSQEQTWKDNDGSKNWVSGATSGWDNQYKKSHL